MNIKTANYISSKTGKINFKELASVCIQSAGPFRFYVGMDFMLNQVVTYPDLFRYEKGEYLTNASKWYNRKFIKLLKIYEKGSALNSSSIYFKFHEIADHLFKQFDSYDDGGKRKLESEKGFTTLHRLSRFFENRRKMDMITVSSRCFTMDRYFADNSMDIDSITLADKSYFNCHTSLFVGLYFLMYMDYMIGMQEKLPEKKKKILKTPVPTEAIEIVDFISRSMER